MNRYYFDHNATTPVSPEVLEAMMPVMTEVYGNASSIHHFGQMAKQRLEMLLDSRWTEHDAGMTSTDPLKFVDTKPYAARLKEAR